MQAKVDVIASRNKFAGYQNKLAMMQRKLDEGERLNKERETLTARLHKTTKLRTHTEQYVKALTQLYRLFIKEDIDFKNRRLDYLSELIRINLQEIFPFEEYKVEIQTDFKNRSNKSRLVLIDKQGNVKYPYINEGKLLQELVSFSAGIGVTTSTSGSIMYMDEAFAASDPNNLTKLSELIKVALDKGMQIVMIEQSSVIYKDIPRREFWLKKDPKSKLSKLINTVDF